MDVGTKAEPREQRMFMLKTDGKTGEQTKVYAYKHSNKFLNWLWHFRYGEYGERISKKEALKFEPQ